MSGARRKPADVHKALIAKALSLPEAWEDHPWGETAIKVGKKVFLFTGSPDPDTQRITVKLTDSHEQALTFSGSAPAGYGLGRSGWVTVTVAGVQAAILEDWVDESYRAIAPKRLVARLAGGGVAADRP